MAKEASPNAMRCLIELMEDSASPPAVRLASAAQILDRALGRPKQVVDVEKQGKSLEEMLRAMWAAKAQERAGGERPATESE